MSAVASAPWITVVAPFAIALLVALVGRQAKRAVPWVSMVSPATLLLVGASALAQLGGSEARALPWTSAVAGNGGYQWFASGVGALTVGWGADTLTAVMLLVVGTVALMVMLFSIGYMEGDPGWVRYFALLSLFTGSMSLLVIADSLPALFAGWELVGACSYLLIGFWYAKPSASAAAVKAFLTTRVGDVAMMFGLAILWKATGSLSFADMLARLGHATPATINIAATLLAVGAIGKSAQFPLHAWLPDAMEGPTPVSALIHAATMVAAGVFLVARLWPLFEMAPTALMVLGIAGTVSALFAALAAVAQRDIKKVLAYSTISQLGFMFVALSVGAWYAAVFHLVAHAAFKALLFLASGSVIHGSGTQDLREMGGLSKRMPWTFAAWVAGSLALAGVVPLAGFFSKDAILDAVFAASPALGVVLFATVAVTAFYTGRATTLAFLAAEKPAAAPAHAPAHAHAHESGPSMLVALMVLVAPTVLLGAARGGLAGLLGHEVEPLSMPLSAIALVLAAAGLAAGWALARGGAAADEAFEKRLGGVWRVLAGAYGWDGLVRRVVVVPVIAGCRALWAVADRLVIDGAVEGSAWLSKRASKALSGLQNGDGQAYAATIAVGVMLMLAFAVWLGRG
jgi:NADH-quinone oxidoreductase subunit L